MKLIKSMDAPYTHADFVGKVLATFPELVVEFAEDPELLHLQMHAFTRFVDRAKAEGNWQVYRTAMRLADELWRRPDDELLNALNVSFLEHLDFSGPSGEEAWTYLSSELRAGWQAMQAYMKRLAELTAPPKRVRKIKPRRKRR